MSKSRSGLLAPYLPSENAQTEGLESSGTGQAAKTGTRRQASIDVYRGLVMFLMLAEVLKLKHVVEVYPTQKWAQWLSFHTSHVPWVGCSLHDMIQPSFSFLVGVSLPFSIASRQSKGASFASMAWHAAWRSLILIVLGICLRSLGQPTTRYFFVDTLTQIGLGYFFLFLLGNASRAIQIAACAMILILYWAWFAFWPLPPADFQAIVPQDWDAAKHDLTGFAAHWNLNANPAWRFDTWFMNLFPRKEPYEANLGGYCTLNFVPTLATMLLGVLAGGILKGNASNQRRLIVLFTAGLGMLLLGWILGETGICPVVKRIWTPSWVLFSGGICFLVLATLYLVCDVGRKMLWAWPLLVIGANSITAYVMSWTLENPTKQFLRRHLGRDTFRVFGNELEPMLLGAAVLLVFWGILYWLYRQRIFVKI